MFLGSNIRFLRKKENLSQEQFAKLFGLKRPNIGSYEEGRATPSLPVIVKISKNYNISIESLILDDLSTVSTSTQQLSLSNSKVHPASQALEEMLVDAINVLADKIRNGMDDMFIKKVPQMIATKYNSIICSDEEISDDTRAQVLNDFRKELELNQSNTY